MPTVLQPNGPLRQNHSWLSTLVSIATEEALAMELLWQKKRRGAGGARLCGKKHLFPLYPPFSLHLTNG